jgi:hypothetical protein
MRFFSVAIGAGLVALAAFPTPLLAQQKTVKACQEEWRANKADNQAKGITEKAYVTQCRAGGATAQPAPGPAAPTPAPSASAPAPVKTAKACREEWQANKASYQAAKITERAYVEKCRAGEAVALPNAPAAAPTPTAPAPKAAPPAAPAPTAAAPAAPPPAPTPAPAIKPAPTAATPPTGADQFQTEAQAKSHCPADLVVWANLNSKIYHFAGHKSYGTTKSGAYMCEKEATEQGFRASKTEKRPST